MIATDQLRSIVERVERLHEERKAIADDIRDIYTEAKSNGFDTKAIKHIVKLRGQDLAERQEFESVVDLYMSALGMLPDFEPNEETGTAVATHVRPHESEAA